MSKLSFISLWISATVGGFLLSLLLIEIGEKSDIGMIEAVIGGLAIALPQSYIIRKSVFSIRWLFSSLLGWAMIAVIGVGAVGWIVPTIELLPVRLLSGAASGAIGGFGIGLAQSWLAIPQTNPLRWQWVFISAVSWGIAVPVGSALGMLLRYWTQLFLGEVVGLLITWLVVAILTGVNAYKILQ